MVEEDEVEPDSRGQRVSTVTYVLMMNQRSELGPARPGDVVMCT